MRNHQYGLSLIELMIGMAIGIILVGGSFYVYASTRAAFDTNESYALMQENARYAFTLLEPDIQLAGLWGNHSNPDAIVGRAADRDAGDVLFAGDCAANWTVDFNQYLGGTNDVASPLSCFPDGRYLLGTDVLISRRAATTPVRDADLAVGQVYLRSSEFPLSEVFIAAGADPTTSIPTGLPQRAENFPVIARMYYISKYTVASGDDSDGIPSLRRVELQTSGGAPDIIDSEVIPGVANMQVQFGIDSNGDEAVDAYVHADNPLLRNDNVKAVRIWLLMRAQNPELGYEDDLVYRMGGRNISVPDAFNDHRHLAVSRTIFLRNR
ncbi:MAG: hypothetical protein HKN70_06015 [Gammaproteobacteria bacterium]|nr:hypothetical protein [Gammaproteobacteria bacterium]